MLVDDEEALFTAGRVAPPGTYVRVDRPDGRRIELTKQEALPVSFDGSIAVYRRIDAAPRLELLAPGSSAERRPAFD